ncbi:MAG: GDSL-type esterase/lipase family protein [Bryobacteraceae bacterium]
MDKNKIRTELLAKPPARWTPYPAKTTLAIAAFLCLLALPAAVPALRNYKILDWSAVPSVLDFPVHKSSSAPIAEEQARLKPDIESLTPRPEGVVDPARNLDHFYAALLATERREPGAVTRILHYGDSPTTADLITADTRALLQERFGDAGRGFCLIAKPWAWYSHRGVEMSASGWKIDVAMQPEVRDGRFGLGGVSFRGVAGSVAQFTLRDHGHTSLEVSYLEQPGGGAFSVSAGDKALGTVATAGDITQPGFAAFDIPSGANRFTVRVTNGPARLFGIEFRKPGPGIEYNSLGVNGAYVSILARMFNAQHWSLELRHYNPDLVIVNYGTNESVYPKFVDLAYSKQMTEVVRRLRAALPDASILVMSPMDRGERDAGGGIATVPVLPRLVSLEHQVATNTGCAFFNTFEAMGGTGTMGRWYDAEPRLVGADFIHPMPGGAKIVGTLLYKALLDGYNRYKMRQLAQPANSSPPSERPSEKDRPVAQR